MYYWILQSNQINVGVLLETHLWCDFIFHPSHYKSKKTVNVNVAKYVSTKC